MQGRLWSATPSRYKDGEAVERDVDVLAMMQSTEREKSATEILREELDATHISRVSARSTTTNFSSTAARITRLSSWRSSARR
jgi:hypothetical protein